jgi:hypothetical protein
MVPVSTYNMLDTKSAMRHDKNMIKSTLEMAMHVYIMVLKTGPDRPVQPGTGA